MATTIGNLAVVLSANAAGFSQGMAAAGKSVNSFVGTMGNMARHMGAMAGLVGIGDAIRGAFTGFADMESSQVAFETLLGSASKATALMKDLEKFGAETPFKLPELVKAAKNLAAFGMEAGEIVPKLRRIGDISSLLGQPIGEMATLFGKAKVAGVLMSEDINQFTERGVPLIQMLAKQFGVAEVQVKKLASEGKISFDHLDKAITTLTSTGGRFAGGMEKQSQTLGGLWSTLSDNIGMSLTKIGEQMVNTFHMKDVLKSVISFTDTFQTAITDAFTGAKFIWDNFLDLTASIFGRAGLKVFSFGLDVAHVFTVNIPEAVKYMFDNWQTVFENIGTWMENWWEKNKAGWKIYFSQVGLGLAKIFDVLIPDQGVFERALAEHDKFKAAVNAAPVLQKAFKPLPDAIFSKRVVGDLEKNFDAGLNAIDKKLGEAKAKAFAGPGITQGTFLTDFLMDAMGMKKAGGATALAGMKHQAEIGHAGAFSAGSKEAYNVLARARDTETAPKKTAENTKETVVQAKKIVKGLDEVVSEIKAGFQTGGWSLDFAGG